MTQLLSSRAGPTRVSIFMNRSNQAIRIPQSMSYPGVTELEVSKQGDVLTLRPVTPSWESFFALDPLDDDGFLAERPDVLESREVDFGNDGE